MVKKASGNDYGISADVVRKQIVAGLTKLRFRAYAAGEGLPARIAARTDKGLSKAFEQGLARIGLVEPDARFEHGQGGKGRIIVSGAALKQFEEMGVAVDQIHTLLDGASDNGPANDPDSPVHG